MKDRSSQIKTGLELSRIELCCVPAWSPTMILRHLKRSMKTAPSLTMQRSYSSRVPNFPFFTSSRIATNTSTAGATSLYQSSTTFLHQSPPFHHQILHRSFASNPLSPPPTSSKPPKQEESREGGIDLQSTSTPAHQRTAAQDLTRVSLCLPNEAFQDIIQGAGLQLTVDGMEYRLNATPVGRTQQIIDKYQQHIAEIKEQLTPLHTEKDQLDALAASFTKKVVMGTLGYLVAQAVVVFKLTFASRLGWDIMEPITYLVTFSTGIFGLAYFSVARKDYLYETVWDQVYEKRKRVVYTKENFDLIRYERLIKELAKKEERLERLMV